MTYVARGREMSLLRSITIIGVALTLYIASTWAIAGASAAPATSSAVGALQVSIAISGAPAKTGDRATITATVTNSTRNALSGVTLLLGLVDMTPGQPVPLGLETWTTDSESVALPPLARGTSASASWHLVMIQPGPLGIYASALASPHGPIESSSVTVLPIRDVRVLNPSNVLPVAFGEPVALLALLLLARVLRRRRGVQHARL